MSDKNCIICERKFGFLMPKGKFKDGVVCGDCCQKAGIENIYKYSSWAQNVSFQIIQNAISNNKPLNMDDEVSKLKKYIQDTISTFENHDALKFSNLYFDNVDKRIMFYYKLLKDEKIEVWNYSDVSRYSPIESGHSEQKKKHTIARAATGGILFGGAGAVVGAMSGKNKSYDIIDDLGIIVYMKDNTSYVVKFISAPTPKVAGIYGDFNELTTLLDRIISDNYNSTVKEETDFEKQLYSLKQLLDDGIITQQEFDDKKKKILGL